MTCVCGEKALRLARREAKTISVFGKIHYQRQYSLCHVCGRGQSPPDGNVGIEPGAGTPGLAKLIALTYREEGYLIGSGTIERCRKQIASLRLKRAGARWTEPGAVQTAKARAAWLSGDWDLLAEQWAAIPMAI